MSITGASTDRENILALLREFNSEAQNAISHLKAIEESCQAETSVAN